MKLLTPALILIVSLSFASLAYAHGGSTEGKVCTAQYAPVCASHPVQCIKAPCYPQYQTYGNSCEAAAHEATVIHEGECTAAESGPVKPSEGEYKPPAGCVAWFDGCNSCSKGEGGNMCTLRACFAQGAGYCTKYETKDPPVVKPTPTPVATTTSTTTEPVAEEHTPFLLSVWHWIQNLFGW
jgi:hypothetical protein